LGHRHAIVVEACYCNFHHHYYLHSFVR
jgi:hypothetical protein